MAIETRRVASLERDSEASRTARDPRPRLLILSDVRLLCDGLLLALADRSDVQVLGAQSFDASVESITAERPDVALLDIGSAQGLGLSQALHRALPDLKIVAIAVADIEEELAICAKAGVAGFVSRDGSIDDVMIAIDCAIRGELACSPRTAAMLVGRLARLEERHDIVSRDGLTRREHEIAALIGEGLSNKEIARRLRIQNPTVKNHIHSILGKLQVRRRGEVAARMRGAAPAHAAL